MPTAIVPYKRKASYQLAKKVGTYAAKKLVNKATQTYKRYKKGKKTKTPAFKNMAVTGEGSQISSFLARNPKPDPRLNLMKKLNAPNYLYWNAGGRLTCTPGVQLVGALSMFSGGNYSTTENSTNDLATLQYKVESSITGTSKTSRIGIISGQSQLRLTNQDNGNVELHLYDVVCKRDTSLDPATCWTTGLNDQSAGSYTTTTLPVGTIPQNSALFNSLYKVKRHTRLILGAGQSHQHNVKMKPHRIFDSTLLQNAAISFKGFTVWTLIVANGLPYNDSSTKTQVSTGNVALDWVHSKQMKYTWNNDTTVTGYYTTNLVTAFTVGENVMETDGDVTSGVTA